jgi:PKD repeat protein
MKMQFKKTQMFLLGLGLVVSTMGFSQNKKIDYSNVREGEHVEYCTSHKKMNALKQDPAFLSQFELDQELLNKDNLEIEGERQTYKIPIVFHVLHNNGVENISREQILDALFILNRDFKLQNADANNVHMDFRASNPNSYVNPADVNIEFVLATKAPNGNCFSGITRTQSSMSYTGDNGNTQVDAIIAGNDVFNGQWAGNRYMNIFICGDIGGAAGYTYTPNTWIGTNMKNGIWILHSYVGSIGTGNDGRSRALTHEVGHWLNLQHTWGPNNNPGNAASCSDDDGVSDTPRCIGLTSCNLNANTCNDLNFSGNTFPIDIRDNTENYMDYSYCSKMFTPGQATRMRSALTSSVGGRNNLWTASNLSFTGTEGNPVLCKANFRSSQTNICAGTQVQFFDDSYNNVTSWNWSFPGGNPSTSTEQNPVVTYNTTGNYSVTLTAGDGSTTLSETKSSYMTVLPDAHTIPFHEGFENYSTTNDVNFEIVSSANNAKWELFTSTGHTGTKCMKLDNFSQTGTNVDEMISTPVDLTSITAADAVTLSFRYSYRKKVSTNTEVLKVFLSKDCGLTWDQRRTISGNSLSNQATTTAWTPVAPSDWVTVHMTNVSSMYWNENFRYKFTFDGSGGNNIYLDDINIYPGAPSDNIVLGIQANELMVEDLVVYPNPTDAELNVQFTTPTNQDLQFYVTDLSGKVLQSMTVQSKTGSNLVLINTSSFASGMYLLKMGTQDASKVMQFIVK